MKLSLAILALSAASVAAQGKKGGGVTAPTPGMSMGGKRSGGKKGGGEAQLCNSGRVTCNTFTIGCFDFTDNFPNGNDMAPTAIVRDTDSCIAFCEENFDPDNYYVEFIKDPGFTSGPGAGFSYCSCYEACFEYIDDTDDSGFENSVIIAVGDADCDIVPDDSTVPFTVCENTKFFECTDMGACSDEAASFNVGPAGGIQDCVDTCFADGFSIAEFNTNFPEIGANCFCYDVFGPDQGDLAECEVDTMNGPFGTIASVNNDCPSLG